MRNATISPAGVYSFEASPSKGFACRPRVRRPGRSIYDRQKTGNAAHYRAPYSESKVSDSSGLKVSASEDQNLFGTFQLERDLLK